MTLLAWKALILAELAAFFLWELVLANLRVARDMVRPVARLRPGVIAVPLELKSDAQVAILSNLITLTPGTLSVDVSTDRKVLFVHVMNAADVRSARAMLKDGFEDRIRRLFS